MKNSNATLALSDNTLFRQKAYINGTWVDSNTDNTFAVFNPASGESIAEVADIGSQETLDALEVADKAFKKWREIPAIIRSEHLENWYRLILIHKEELAAIVTIEQGKPLYESRAEVEYAASYVKWFAEESKRIYGDIIPSTKPNHRSLVIKQAVGVVAAITPWNFPVAMITRKVAPALAVGCAIVVKPAPETPLSALALAKLAHDAEIPLGLFNVLPSIQSQLIGEVLTSSSIVKKLSFTGSTAVGKQLLKQCAGTVKRTSMELGGNAPAVIFEDSDLDLAVKGIMSSKFRNSGQTCICTNRILVQDTVHDIFAQKLMNAIESFKLGDGMDVVTTHGPVITKKALTDIHKKVDQAIRNGANLLIGGKPAKGGGYFYEPTILTDVKTDMDLFQKEIFGPVAPIIKFTTESDAIQLANSTSSGLAAYVYTKDISRTWRLSESLDFGMIGINETAISSEIIPFGGVKESGHGREGSKYGLNDYLDIKYVCLGGLGV